MLVFGGDMALPFLPLSQTEVSGYRLDSAIGSTLGFKMDDSGSVIGLIIPGNHDFFAQKEKQ
jgi:hypothetical protein